MDDCTDRSEPLMLMDATRSCMFSSEAFNRIRLLAGELMGINLADSKRDMVYGRLRKRLSQLGLTHFDSYCDLLETHNADELEYFTNAITTNLTSFFRQEHHFKYLATKVLPDLILSRASQHRLRFWSAGCSSGEEPYSMAMTLLEQGIQRPDWDVRILATDIDSNVLAKAKTGIYPQDVVHKLDKDHQQWMCEGSGVHSAESQVTQALRELIIFKQLNLLHPWPFNGPFDCIFCRNVVIYFSKETQTALFERFAQILPIGGYLFIGYSELLYKVCRRFEPIGKAIYQRVN